jgi:hypothetical protein
MTRTDPENNDVRALFAGARPDSGPPLGLSAEDIAARGARVHRRRRQLAAMGGTVAVVAVAAVLTTTLAFRPHVTPAGPGSTSVPITRTAPTAVPTGVPTKTGTPPPTTATTSPGYPGFTATPTP